MAARRRAGGPVEDAAPDQTTRGSGAAICRDRKLPCDLPAESQARSSGT